MHFVRRAFSFPEALDRVLHGHFKSELKRNANSLKQLWPMLAKGRGQKSEERHYSMDASFASAYASYYLPANLLKVSLILEEMTLMGISWRPTSRLRWLDVGSGPGTALWGLAWWAKHRELEFDFCGLEQSKQFLKLAGALSRELFSALSLRDTVRWEPFEHSAKNPSGLLHWVRTFDPHVVSLMNSIGEMSQDPLVRATWMQEVVDQVAAKAAIAGEPRWLVLIEPGSQAASRELLALRDSLRANPKVKIWLPCLSERPCGALEKPGDWCHEEASCHFPDWMSVLGAEAGLKKESLLFSYLVCSVGIHPEKPSGWPGDGKRVVSQLLREKGLTQCFLCTANGKEKARVLNAKQAVENEELLSSVRGQVFDAVETDEKANVLSLKSHELVGYAGDLDPTVFPILQSDRRS